MGFVSRALFVPGHKTLERLRGTPGGAEKKTLERQRGTPSGAERQSYLLQRKDND